MAEHWIADDGTRKRFWSYVKDELNLTEDQVHKALDVESLYDWRGTKRGAVKRLRNYMDEMLGMAARGLPEAPALAWTKFQTPAGFEWSFTVRAGLSPALNRRAIEQMRDAVAAFEELAASNGWKGTSKRQPAVPSPAPEAPSPTKAAKTEGDNGYQNVNEAALEQIAVQPDGQIQFEVDGLRYPLKDSRGATVVASLFGEDCWTPDFAPMHLSEPGFYEPNGLVVKYGKSDKGYWDVLSVHRAV